jgi:hypothetical protein
MPVILTKQIRPKKLKIDEVRLQLLNAIRAEGRAILKEYGKTVATWRRKPKFEQLIGLDKQQATVLVGTDSEIYKYVDEGTRPHRIVPRRARYLRFQVGYRAKTVPNVIGSTAGGKFGPIVYRKAVQHPGFPGRNFTKIIQHRRKKPFRDAMLKAAQKGVAKANARGQA